MRTLLFFAFLVGARALTCNDGQFTTDDITCQNCTANSYCQGGVIASCPASSVSSPGASRLSDCVCPANSVINNGLCICNDGYIRVGSLCSLCPANAFCPDENTITNCTNFALSLPGQSSATGCNQCPAGYIQNSPTASPISCRPCAQGYACPDKATEVKCLAGTFAPPLGTSCVTCAANSYALNASSACTACSAHATAPSGSTSPAACLCSNGYYMDFYRTCQPCPQGMYCVQNMQTVCAIGSYSAQGQSVCTLCAAGTYQDGIGSSSCKTCPGGSSIIKTTVSSDLQTLGIQNRAILDVTSDMIYVQGAQNYLLNAQGGNITTWSFYASNAGCVVTPVILGGSFVSPTGTYTFSILKVGTTRNTAEAGPHTFPFTDDGSVFTVPVADLLASPQQVTYFGWYFTGATCIPYDLAPLNTPTYVWSWPYVPGSTTQFIWPSTSYPGTATFWSVSVASSKTKLTTATTGTGASSIFSCSCPDGTWQIPSGVCQATCPDGKYMTSISATACSLCAQGSYCVNSIIKPCGPNNSSLPGSTACSFCVNPGQSTNIQLYTCGLLKTCQPNTPASIDGNGWRGLGTILSGVGSTNGTFATPWSPGSPVLGLQLNPAVDRPYALIMNDVNLNAVLNDFIAVQFYYRCAGVACPDWLAVDYSQDGGDNFVQVLNITDFSSSTGSWVQIATNFFQVVTLVPTRLRFYSQMALRSCVLWIGNVQIVDLGYWKYDNINGVRLLTTETVDVPRFDGSSGYKQPVAATNLKLYSDRVYLDLSSVATLYSPYSYVASIWASGVGTLTLSTSTTESRTWTVTSSVAQYSFSTVSTPTTFSVSVTGNITIKGPSLTIASAVVGCQSCLANYTCSTPTPVACTANSWSPVGSNSSTQCVCNPGYWGLPGTYDANGHADSCKPCPVGHYCPGGAVSVVCPNGTITTELGQTSCQDCDASDYCAFGTMHGCPPNSMSPKDSWDVTQCICNPGFYGVAPGCTICEQGYYCINGAKTACTSNAISPAMSSTASACYCGAGYYGVQNAACAPCTEGSYCRLGLIHSCPVNMWSPNMSSLLTDCICDYGYYTMLATCSACSAGSYKTSRGAGACTSCGAGQYSATRGASSNVVCVGCSPGTYGVSVGQYQCQACAAGSYASGLGSSGCKSCWAGAYATLGASVCSMCAAGTYSETVAAVSIATCQACQVGAWALANSSSCTLCGACPYWRYPPAVHFYAGSLSAVSTAPTQQHYAFAQSLSDGSIFMALDTSIYKVNLQTGGTSAALVIQGPSAQAWWYASISPSVLGNFLYAIKNQQVFRIDLGMNQYDIVYSSNAATCVVEDSTRPRVVLWIVQATVVRQVDPIAAIDLNDYTISGAHHVCVNPKDSNTLYVTGSFGLKSLDKTTGAFTTLKTGAAYTVCQVTPDGHFVVMTQTSPKVVVVYSIYDQTLTNIVGNAAVSGMYVDSANIVLGVDLTGIVNVSYSYADSRDCPVGSFSENGGNIGPQQCTTCPYGNLCPGGTSVSSCVEGTYSNATGLREQAQCLTCPEGSFCPGAVCNDATGAGCSVSGGVCTGPLCDASNNMQTCPPGSYSPFSGLVHSTDCPLCVNGFYCPNPLKQILCPNNTWSQPGANDLSSCVCMPGYRCIITKIVHAQVILNIQYADFSGSSLLQSKYIAAIAAAAGVSTSQVSIQGIFTYTAPPSGRRLLTYGSRWNNAAVDIHTLIRIPELCDLDTLNDHLAAHGLPSHRGVSVSLHNEVIQTYRNH